MSALVAFAEQELGRLRDGEDDELQDLVDANVISVVKAFSEAGHSGSTAAYALGVIERLLRFEPLTPLTGADEEWYDVSEASGCPMWQNKRCSHVFKDERGAYDIDAEDSKALIEFPYTPPTSWL